MVQVTEVGNEDKNNVGVVNAEYRGPGDDFPFLAYHILGATHLLLGVAIIICGIVHVALGEEDRLFFLLTGGVSLWCPVGVIATGIIGATISEDRYWEIRCLKMSFLVMSLVTAFMFMVPLALVTGFVDFPLYHVSNMDPVEDYVTPMAAREESRTALMWVIVALACLEFLVCILSACICACCSPLYMEAQSAPEPQQQIIVRQQQPPPVYVEKPEPQKPIIIVQKPAPQPTPQPIIVQKPAPQPTPQPIYVQAPAPRPPPPIIMQQQAPGPQMLPQLMGPPPPPMPIYAQPSIVGMQRTVRPVGMQRRVNSGIF